MSEVKQKYTVETSLHYMWSGKIWFEGRLAT